MRLKRLGTRWTQSSTVTRAMNSHYGLGIWTKHC